MFHLFNSVNMDFIECVNSHTDPYFIISEKEVPPIFRTAETIATSYEDLLDKGGFENDLHFFKNVFDNYDVWTQIFADDKGFAVLFSKMLKLLFGKNVTTDTAYLLYCLAGASTIFRQKAIYFKGRSTEEFIPTLLTKANFVKIFDDCEFTGDSDALSAFRSAIRLRVSFEYLVAHVLYNKENSDEKIDEKIRRVVFNCFKRTNLENVYLTQMMDYPLYNTVTKWETLPTKLKAIQNPLQYTFNDISEHLEEIKDSMREFYPDFYEFSINHVDCLKEKGGAFEFLKQNIDFLFSKKKVKQVFFDHSDFFDCINRYTLYLIFTAYRENNTDLLKQLQLAD